MPRPRTACRSPSSSHRRAGQPFACPRDAWRHLLAAVDRAFHTSERYWHHGRYYVRHKRTFLALVRDPKNDHVEARIASTARPRGRKPRDTFWNDHPESDAPPPHLQTVPIRTRDDIACALRKARHAQRAWGKRSTR